MQIAQAKIQQQSPISSPSSDSVSNSQSIPSSPKTESPKEPSVQSINLADKVSAVALGYFADLQKGRYPEALNKLSPEFREKKSLTANSLAEYWRHFTIIRVLSIKSVSKKQDGMHVQMVLYFQKGSVSDGLSGDADIRLIQIGETWKIDKVSFDQ